jgi:hypothetical protein
MTIQTPNALHTVTHEVHRLTIPISAPFDDFRARYEQAVPELDAGRLEALVAAGADWQAILAAAEENAPYHFMRYWEFDATRLMQLAGNSARCVEYLMGNHTIAERMYRHDPAIMLYAPLRSALYTDDMADTWFAIDQPSTLFRSFGDRAITKVGLGLDRKLAALLEHLDTPVPPALTR